MCILRGIQTMVIGIRVAVLALSLMVLIDGEMALDASIDSVDGGQLIADSLHYGLPDAFGVAVIVLVLLDPLPDVQ